MAEPKQLVFNEQEVELPDSYQLPAGLDLALQSVVAFIDGAGASGDFVPALSIFAQSGQLMARVPVDQTFAVGDSGVVTWAPFLRKRATSTPPTPGSLDYCYMLKTTNTSVLNATPTFISGYNSSAATGGFTADTTNGILRISQTGLYLVHGSAHYTGASWGVGQTLLRLNAFDQLQEVVFSFARGELGYNPLGQPSASMSMFLVTSLVGPDDGWTITLDQNSGANKTADSVLFAAARIGDL